MSSRKRLGVIELIIGIVILIVGLSASHYSLADPMSNTTTGRFMQASTWYIIVGIGAALAGLVLLASGLVEKVLNNLGQDRGTLDSDDMSRRRLPCGNPGDSPMLSRGISPWSNE